MKNLTKSFLSFLCLVLAMGFNTTVSAQQSLTTITGWNAYVHLPASYSTSSQSYPTIVFFPGLGEIGTTASKVIQSGPGAYITQGWNGNVVVNGGTVEFIVISIQPPTAYPSEFRMNQAIQSMKSLYRIDNNRLYLTGLSHGGWCSSTFVTGDAYGGPYTYASQVAAVVTVEGVIPDDNSPYPNLFDNYANVGGRYLGFEQALDNRDTRTVVNRMNATRPNSGIYVPTNFGGGGHCCWEQFYGGSGVQPGNFTLDGVSQNIYQWMAKQSLNGTVTPPPPPPANIAPVANAGTDKTITLPVNTASLSGSGTDADGTISSYKWTLYYGPNMATITNSTSANATISGLIQGTYQVDLTVTDNAGATNTDRMQVIVNAAANQAPVANAGADKVITLPANSTSITGTGTDADGTISAYAWSKVSGPAAGTMTNATSATMSLTGLTQGVYQYQLQVTDNAGATATDNVQVTVNAAVVTNQPPVANAGTDITISLPATTTPLPGTGTDADGTIVSYKWELYYGPNFATVTNSTSPTATASGLVVGQYQFDLTVTDNSGATSTDRVQVTVNPAPVSTNQAPVANAGADQVITLPVNSLSISGTGTDADGTIAGYAWTKVSGPAAGTMTNANTAALSLTGLAEGIYQYQLTVTDNSGATGTDNVQVTVNAAPVPPASTNRSVRVNMYNGTTPYNNAQWNNWKAVSGVTSSPFLYDDGTASVIKSSITANDLMVDNGSSYATGATVVPGAVLRFNSANTSNRTLTISGLDPTKQYGFEFYGSRSNSGNKTVFYIGNLTDTISTDNNINDVAKFINITPDNTGKVDVTLGRVGTWNYIAGFTISEGSVAGKSAGVVPTSVPAVMATSSMLSVTTNTTPVNGNITVRVYPNPFVNTIQVDLGPEISGKYTINLLDASGKVLVSKTGSKTNVSFTESVNVSRLSYGIYFLEVISNNGRSVTKVKKILPTQY